MLLPSNPSESFAIVHEPVLGVELPVFKKRYSSLIDLFRASALFGDKDYLVFEDQRISYTQHLQKVAQTSEWLSANFDIKPGDRVAIYAANSIEWVVAFWAIASLGAVAVALNGWWIDAEALQALDLTKPKLLLADNKRLLRLDSVQLPCEAVPLEYLPKSWNETGARLPELAIAEDDPVLILFTSGTTGQAKGVLSSHRGHIGFVQCNQHTACTAMQQHNISLADFSGPITLGTSPFFHNSGFDGGILMTMAMGGTLILSSGRFDAERILGLIETEKVSNWTILGGMGPRLLQADWSPYDLSSVNTLNFGGAPVAPGLQEQLRKVFPNAQAGQAIGYGMTETVSVPVSFSGADFADKPLATGRAMPLHEVEIRDDSGHHLPEGQEGLIYVRSAFSMLAYWGNAQATRDTIDEQRWLKTGDIGYLQDGLLYVSSRKRDMILRPAENIYPIEIEQRLDAHPAVRESAVYGVPDAIHGQAVKAAVVLKQPGTAAEAELEQWCRAALAPFKIPQYWELSSEPLPRNASGKLVKTELS